MATIGREPSTLRGANPTWFLAWRKHDQGPDGVCGSAASPHYAWALHVLVWNLSNDWKLLTFIPVLIGDPHRQRGDHREPS